MTTQTARAAQRAAYNAGFRDVINNLPATPSDPLLTYYYQMGYDEGAPKRRVPTFISTPTGPIRASISLEQAAFLQSSNRHVPGGRR